MSTKKIASPSASDKRAKEEAAARWLAGLPSDVRRSIPAPNAGASVITPIEVKRESTVRAEAARKHNERISGKQRRIRGFKTVEHKGYKAPNGKALELLIEAKRTEHKYEEPSEDDLLKRVELENVLRRARPIQAPATPVKYANAEIEREMTAFHGKASSEALEQVRAAYQAIFGSKPPDDWAELFRARIRFTLQYRLAGSKPPKAHPQTGAAILSELKARHPRRVPAWLTSAGIDDILRSVTLGRGGAGKKNVDRAIDELIAKSKLK